MNLSKQTQTHSKHEAKNVIKEKKANFFVEDLTKWIRNKDMIENEFAKSITLIQISIESFYTTNLKEKLQFEEIKVCKLRPLENRIGKKNKK